MYQKESVYDSPTDEKYFDVVAFENGWKIFFKPDLMNNLSGKITIPSIFTKNGQTKKILSFGKTV